jgi:hypothetical protein
MKSAASVGPPISRSPLKSRRSSSRIVSGSPLVRRQPGGAACIESTDLECDARDAILGWGGDQRIGLADSSIAVLAARYRTRIIVTLDHRHFDVVRPLTGGRFTVLP